MSKKNKNTEADPCVVYADIIHLPHHQSKTRPHMSLYDRAAQFAPFSALSGYDDMVEEEARLTDEKIELNETDLENLNRQIGKILADLKDGMHPVLTITYFIPDLFKAGGRYETITEKIRMVDEVNHQIILEKTKEKSGMNVAIAIDDVLEILETE